MSSFTSVDKMGDGGQSLPPHHLPSPAVDTGGGYYTESRPKSQQLQSQTSSDVNSTVPPDSTRRQTPKDYQFGKLIGEGSFSSVFLAREVKTKLEFAIKVCIKIEMLKQKRQEYIRREKAILIKILENWDENRPFFVKLHSTFQDHDQLYFVTTYACHGTLLDYIIEYTTTLALAPHVLHKCSQFYAAEILLAIEFLHRNHIMHRDLKPENILLNSRMHILVTDFGSAKIVQDEQCSTPPSTISYSHRHHPDLNNHTEQNVSEISTSDFSTKTRLQQDNDRVSEEEDSRSTSPTATTEPRPASDVRKKDRLKKRRSFVGTAQYVSPEILTNDFESSFASDLWAFGCIICQLITGSSPFTGASEYFIFRKISTMDYSLSNIECQSASNLIEKLLILNPLQRIGSDDRDKYISIRKHEYFNDINFSTISTEIPPPFSHFPSLSPHDSTSSQQQHPTEVVKHHNLSKRYQYHEAYRVNTIWDRDEIKPGAESLTMLHLDTIQDCADEDTDYVDCCPPSVPSWATSLLLSLNVNVDSRRTVKVDSSIIQPFPFTSGYSNSHTSPLFNNCSRSKKQPNTNLQHVTQNLCNRPKLDSLLEELKQYPVLRQALLDIQSREHKFHEFVDGKLILRQGLLDKKKSLFPRERMFIITEGPSFYYIDPSTMTLKGEIPWNPPSVGEKEATPSIFTEIRDFYVFYVHTPNRVYHLIDNTALHVKAWCDAILEVDKFYFKSSVL